MTLVGALVVSACGPDSPGTEAGADTETESGTEDEVGEESSSGEEESSSGSTEEAETTEEETTEEEESTEEETTEEETTGEELCGNGILDPGEECDGDEGCSEDCELLNFTCNPITNTGCEPGEICVNSDMPNAFECVVADGSGPTQNQECDPDNATLCGVQHVCLQAMVFDRCNFGGCCAQWCDVDDPNACSMGTTCEPWWIDGVFDPPAPGLDHLGTCY